MHLPAKYRRIIVLRHYDQLDVEEIAETLGAPEGTIKSWLFRARALLRRELSGLFEPGQIEMAV
jgi:RNA polymerase sigma-70 factor (ECF subfamily)